MRIKCWSLETSGTGLACLAMTSLLAGCVVYTNPKDMPALGGPDWVKSPPAYRTPPEPMQAQARPVYRSDVTPRYEVTMPPAPVRRPPQTILPYQTVAAAPPQKPQTLPAPPQSRMPVVQSATAVPRGEVVDVQAGDSLEILSRRHAVSISAILTANNMTTLEITPGQKLIIPQRAGGARPLARLQSTAPSRKTEAAAEPSPARLDVQSCGWSGCTLVPSRKPS